MCHYVDLNIAHKCYFFTYAVNYFSLCINYIYESTLKSFGIKVKTLYTIHLRPSVVPNQCQDFSSCGDRSSEAVDSNIELNSTKLHLRSPIVFILYVS